MHTKVIDENFCIEGYECQTFGHNNLATSIGLTDSSNYGYKIFPNPSDGFIYLTNESSKIISFEIITNSGKIHISGKTSFEINLSKLENGMYFLKLFKDGRLLSFEKIILEK